MVTFKLNGQDFNFEGATDTPLLWVIRDAARLTGTKFGCGMALCGACTVYLDNQPIRACVTPVTVAAGKNVTTIEGVEGKVAQAVIDAWVEHSVPQCGYCQSGQVMSAVALLTNNSDPSDADIDQAMRGNLCRCGTYQRIRAAIHTAAKQLQ